MSFVYGNAIVRLSGPGVAIASGERRSRNQAYSLPAATSESRLHSRPRCAWCSGMERPRRARIAFSKSGYTWTGRNSP